MTRNPLPLSQKYMIWWIGFEDQDIPNKAPQVLVAPSLDSLFTLKVLNPMQTHCLDFTFLYISHHHLSHQSTREKEQRESERDGNFIWFNMFCFPAHRFDSSPELYQQVESRCRPPIDVGLLCKILPDGAWHCEEGDGMCGAFWSPKCCIDRPVALPRLLRSGQLLSQILDSCKC